MDDFLDRLLALWTVPLDDRADPVAEFRAVYTDPVTVNGTPMSCADLVERARAMQRTYADRRTEVVHRLAADDRLAVAFRIRARHVGPLATPLGTVPPTGREVSIRVTDVLTLTDGRISDIWMIADDLALLHDLSAVRLTGEQGVP
ncbi:ester cyclase [Plantactinospora siamensis]|uniref:Ester cyclase n=1 Tax=Plantactinospora siamensis TaxID=555372 RepID=A0ABV6NYC7_9ACTN